MSTPASDFEHLPELAVMPPGSHPPLDRLLAAGQDVLPPEAEAAIQQHLASCRLCAGLLADLATLPEPVLTTEQQSRIAAILPQPTSPRTKTRPWVIGAIAASILAIAGLYAATHRPQQAMPPTIASIEPPTATATPEPLLPLTPLPPPQLGQQPPTLLTRGAHIEKNPDAAALRPAFEAYSAGDYALAVRRLSPLTAGYPHSDVVFLYLGIGQLFLQQNALAAASLKTAWHNAPASHADPATWYSAVAAQRLHTGEETQWLEALCHKTASAYSAQSCRALPTHP